MKIDIGEINLLKEQYKEGARVILYNMAGEDMPVGLKGTIKLVDDIGQIHVKWDNGRTLPINTELDTFSVI